MHGRDAHRPAQDATPTGATPIDLHRATTPIGQDAEHNAPDVNEGLLARILLLSITIISVGSGSEDGCVCCG